MTVEIENTHYDIFLVEDHPLTRSGMAHTINSETGMKICGEAEDASTAFEKIKLMQPDLVIADISLVNSTGIDLIQMMRAEQVEIPVLVVSMHDEPFYINKSFKAGANGYLFKRDSVDHVADAIRDIMSGKQYTSHSLDKNEIETNDQQESSKTCFEKLSKRETQIFDLLGSGKNRKEIADQLNISLKTVESHVDNMRTKLGVGSGFELVYLAIKHSLTPNDPEKI